MRKRDCWYCGTKVWCQLKNLPSRQYPQTWAKAEFLDGCEAATTGSRASSSTSNKSAVWRSAVVARNLLQDYQDYRYQGGSAAGQIRTPPSSVDQRRHQGYESKTNFLVSPKQQVFLRSRFSKLCHSNSRVQERHFPPRL